MPRALSYLALPLLIAVPLLSLPAVHAVRVGSCRLASASHGLLPTRPTLAMRASLLALLCLSLLSLSVALAAAAGGTPSAPVGAAPPDKGTCSCGPTTTTHFDIVSAQAGCGPACTSGARHAVARSA